MDNQQRSRGGYHKSDQDNDGGAPSSRGAMQQDVDSAAISETTAPLAPPAPLDVVGTATNGVGGHRRHRVGGRSRSWGNDADVQCHDDREDDDDDDAVLRHTPIMTRFTPLPDCT
mmetsp:Transcript_1553/g.2964  ORF Transcript_1553/g.2964 Transcript_1553/m.2964 type:complete len:115 (+) Transcript_1553:143-487(+)